MSDASRSADSPFTLRIQRSLTSSLRAWPWSPRRLIVVLRLCAAVAAAALLTLAWRVMAVMPAPVDVVIAAAACVAFSYWFDRGDDA